MNNITREEFTSAVAATITSVHHLYREVARLDVELRQADRFQVATTTITVE